MDVTSFLLCGWKKSDIFRFDSACLGRFLIGREKEGAESEVARLIKESLELDKTCRKVQRLKRRRSIGGVDSSIWFDCAAFCVCA